MNIDFLKIVSAMLVSAMVCGCDGLLAEADKADAIRLEPGRVTVVAPKDCSKVVTFAANELAAFLGESLGAPVPVAAEEKADGVNIVLGASAAARAAGLDLAALQPDGFYIACDGTRVIIAGRDSTKATDNPADALKEGVGGEFMFAYDRGTLNGVYTFLEENCGVRFYFPGPLGTIVPKRHEIALSSGTRAVNPFWSLRRDQTLVKPSGINFDGTERNDPLTCERKLGFLRRRMGQTTVPSCHGASRMNFGRRFAKSHPEYFCLIDKKTGRRGCDPTLQHKDQICWSSPVIEEMYQDIKAYLTGRSAESRGMYYRDTDRYGWDKCFQPGIVDIMPQDGMLECFCDKCQAAYDKTKPNYAADFIWGKIADMANRLKAEGIPGTLSSMSYEIYNNLPSFELPDNVLVGTAMVGAWERNDPEGMAVATDTIKRWSAARKGKFWLWTWANNYCYRKLPGVPFWTPRALGKYYRDIAPYVFGDFMESESERFYWSMLQYYLHAKIGWNPRIDVDAAVDEFHILMYGSAAKEMIGVSDLLEETYMNKVVSAAFWEKPTRRDNPHVGHPKPADLWERIYTKEFLSDLTARFDRAAAQVGSGSLERQRIDLARRELLAPLVRESTAYFSKATEKSNK